MFFYSTPSAVGIILVILSWIATTAVYAQCDSNQIPNFYAEAVGDTTTRITGNQIFAGYGFEMQYDSSQVMYRVAEFKKNGARLILDDWCEGQVILDSTPVALGSISKTDVFTVSSGDVLTLYREIAWYDPAVYEQEPDNYYADDTLDYVIELINASSGNRMALLDSIGILSRSTRGVPTMYGTTELMKLISYVVPGGNNVPVRIRMRPQARGNGAFNFKRTDSWGLDLSGRLADTLWQGYLSAYGSVLFKPVRWQDVTEFSEASEMLTASPNPSGGRIAITYMQASDDRSTTVQIYDAAGRLLYVPAFNPPGKTGMETVEFQCHDPGTYFIALIHGDRLVSSQKIVVQP